MKLLLERGTGDGACPRRHIPALYASYRTVRFITVGALGFVVQVVALAILVYVAHWHWSAATVVAVSFAVVHNFLWHQRWTWRDRLNPSAMGRRSAVPAHEADMPAQGRFIATRRPGLARFVRFTMTTGLTSIAGNAALMTLYVSRIGLPPVAANLAAVATMSALNFVVSDRWVFRSAAPDPRRGVRGSRTWRFASLRCVTIVMVAASAMFPVPAGAAPPPETVAAWDRYVQAVEGRMSREVTSARSNEGVSTGDRAAGAGVSGPVPARCSPLVACEGESISVPSGTISRWRGTVFIPGISLDQLLHRLQHPGTPPPQDDVAASRVLARTPDGLRVYIRLVRSAIVTVTYDTEHDMRFHRWAPALAAARSEATRIEEVGGDDHGFLWRLNSYWRYRQTRDGVEVELESLTLSRHVPALVRPVAGPIVTRIARESVVRTLEALRRYLLNSLAQLSSGFEASDPLRLETFRLAGT